MMTYQLLSIRQRLEWIAYVQRSVQYDFYHTWYYHFLSHNTAPLLFVYETPTVFIAIPLIKRKIEDTDLFDLTSAYGYTGPISNLSFEKMPRQVIAAFKAAFLDFMKTGNYVCVFTRLNPFLQQHHLLENIGGVTDNGRTVYIDLRVPIETQRLKYEKRLARKIRQLRKLDYQIRIVRTEKDIRAFAEMYHENMRRNGAAARYHYDESYFKKLLNTTECDCKLIMVYHNEKPICGNIVMYTNHIIRNHLSATANAYIRFSPGKLIIDEISIIARSLGISYYHLGGGIAGKEDSLFHFKLAFSNLTLPDKTWCFIAEPERYEDLSNGRASATETAFFPKYRDNK